MNQTSRRMGRREDRDADLPQYTVGVVAERDGVLDLGAILNEASSGAGGPLSNFPPDALAQLKSGFAGQGITWTVQAADGSGNYVFADVAIPFQAAKAAGKVSRQMMAGSQAGPGGGGGGPAGGGM